MKATTSVDEIRKINIKEFKELVKTAPVENALMVWGPPGVGKTQSVEQAAAEMGAVSTADKRGGVSAGLKVHYELLTTKAPEDFEGVPFPQTIDGVTYSSFLPPSRFREMVGDDGPEIIIFLDELNTAQQHVQVVAMQLALDKRVGSLQLSKKRLRVIAAGNRASDRAAINPMPKPLENRFEHYQIVVDPDIWAEWAINHDIDPIIIGFIRSAPSKLMTFNPDDASPAYATPRSYEALNRRVRSLGWTHPLSHKALAACVGDGVARELMAFRNLKDELPSIDEILKDPQNAPVPLNKPDRCYFLLSALVSKVVSKPDQQTMTQSLHYVTRMPVEQGAKYFKDIWSHKSNARKFLLTAFSNDKKLAKLLTERWQKVLDKLKEARDHYSS